MAYDDDVARRVAAELDGLDLTEKKMFGGVGFMLRGNMAIGVMNYDLIVRVGPDAYEDSLAKPHVREFDFTGRAMTGWVVIGPEGYEREQDFREWIDAGRSFALSLPPK